MYCQCHHVSHRAPTEEKKLEKKIIPPCPLLNPFKNYSELWGFWGPNSKFLWFVYTHFAIPDTREPTEALKWQTKLNSHHEYLRFSAWSVLTAITLNEQNHSIVTGNCGIPEAGRCKTVISHDVKTPAPQVTLQLIQPNNKQRTRRL